MNLRIRNIVLILLAALLLAFAGAYGGTKLAQSKQASNNIPSSIIERPSGDSADLEKVSQAYELIQKHYIEDVESDLLIEGAIDGMIDALDDPYSSYMDLESMEDFQEQIESSFEGIGAEVSMVDGVVTIVAPIKNSPAEEAGLRPNDQIIKIDQEDIDGLDLDEAVDLIRGEKGSEVEIEINRPGVSDPFSLTITRDEIPIETVYASVEEEDGKKTGIIEITSFAETTAEEFEKELTKLEEDNIDGLVLDVRGNPGGLLDSIEDILKHFIPKDTPYLQREDADGEVEKYYTTLEEKKDYPISVLIDEGSASASEILAVAMKEIGYDVVGQTSFGKGTVQQAVPLGDGSTVKLTFYKWLSPEGNWIHDEGVEPTIEVKLPDYFYSSPIKTDQVYSSGDEGEDIENIQVMLQGVGYDLKDNGKFDQETEAAVKAFQSDEGLEATGKVDEETAQKLEVKIIETIRDKKDDPQLEKALQSLY